MKFSQVLYLLKLAETLETPASSTITSHFPFLQQQQTWKYKHSGDHLIFKSGETHFAFKLPEKFEFDHEKFPDFKLERLPQTEIDFEKVQAPEKTAQIHKSHPGEIYLTLQEGVKNPTLNLSHVSGSQWRGKMKKPVAKKIKELSEDSSINPSAVSTEVNTLSKVSQLMRRDLFLASAFK